MKGQEKRLANSGKGLFAGRFSVCAGVLICEYAGKFACTCEIFVNLVVF